MKIKAFITLCLLTASCAVLQAADDKDTTPDVSFQEFLETVAAITQKAQQDYVEPIKYKDMLTGALNGMLHTLDPHSEYFPPKEFKELREGIKGEFGGVGMIVTMDKSNAVKIISPIDDTPAKAAGLQTGDIILAVDGEPVMDQSLTQVVDKIHGEPGTTIVLMIKREGKDPFDVKLKRAIIKTEPVKWQREDNVAYIRLSVFNEKSTEMLQKAIEELKKIIGEHNIQGYVLDVRNNPGGLLDQAVEVTDLFLEEGEIVSIRGQDPKDIQRLYSKGKDLTQGKPVVVLINGGSASAAEIIAGALQDNKRAVLVGTKSFGKGSVQTVYPMAGGSGLKLTTAKYYTPSGRSIQATGIEPDIVVDQIIDLETVDESGRFKESSLNTALKPEDTKPASSEKEILNTPANDNKNASSKKPSEKEKKKGNLSTDWKGQEVKDYQLLRALDIVRGIAIYQEIGKQPETSNPVSEAKAKTGK